MPVEVIDLTSDLSDDNVDTSSPADSHQDMLPTQPRARNGRFGSSLARDDLNGSLETVNRRNTSHQELNGPTHPHSERSLVPGVAYNQEADGVAAGGSMDEAFRQERIHGFEKFHEGQALHRRIAPRNALAVSSPAQQNQQTRGPDVKNIEWKRAMSGMLHKFHIQRQPTKSPRTLKQIEFPTKATESHLAAQGSKRPASSVEHASPVSNPKRARTDDAPTSEQRVRPAVLVDVTDPDTERVTYSDDPELPRGLPFPAANANSSSVRKLYSPEEDELLRKSIEEDGISWQNIVALFNGRTEAALRTRYLSNRRARDLRDKRTSDRVQNTQEDDALTIAPTRSKRERKSTTAPGFVTWKPLKRNTSHKYVLETSETHLEEFTDQKVATTVLHTADALCRQDGAYPCSLSRNLRYRELGLTTRRAWTSARTVTVEMTNHAFQGYRLQKQYHGTSGDVVALSWSPDGSRFAAGSIAISDPQSMQYNMPRNLLLGDKDELLELADHYVPRPTIKERNNVNALHAMRESQDPRLFMTVSSTGFSPDGSILLTASADKTLRQYEVSQSLDQVTHPSVVAHTAPIDLLAVHPQHNYAATGCQTASKNLFVFAYSKSEQPYRVFYPGHDETPPQVPSFPSALKWGVAPSHHNFLLAGFDGKESGETRLWDVKGEKRIELHAATRGVFDVAWNPRPSAASISFVVASSAATLAVDRGADSVIQCFAPNQTEGRRVLWWECQAKDINDVVMCPYDANLIAAGATDGKVYIWDYRYVDQSHRPLHVLEHGKTENVLHHDGELWREDTGVRFLSWGATKDRLYSGSSDGVVKIWNPYRSPGNAFINDVPTLSRERAAVMSGSFSPDYRELLIGKENGRIELFEAGGQAVYKALDFKLRPAASQQDEDIHESKPKIEMQSDENERLSDTPEQCNLDCAVLRGPQEDEIEDSERSSLRIPDMLRTVAKNAIAAKTPPEEIDVRCFHCRPERKNFGKSCAQCAAKSTLREKNLLVACVVCAGPARLSTDETMPIVCERCCFACFRCGEPAILSPDMTRVTCPPCGYTWEVNALGYELATPLTYRPKEEGAHPVVSSADEEWNAFGEEERHHHAGQVSAKLWLRNAQGYKVPSIVQLEE